MYVLNGAGGSAGHEAVDCAAVCHGNLACVVACRMDPDYYREGLPQPNWPNELITWVGQPLERLGQSLEWLGQPLEWLESRLAIAGAWVVVVLGLAAFIVWKVR